VKKVGPKRRRRIARIARFFADHPSLNADRWIGAGAAYPRGHLPWADPKVAVSAFAQRLYIAAAVQGVPRGQGGVRPPKTKGAVAPKAKGAVAPKAKGVRTKDQGGRRTKGQGLRTSKEQGVRPPKAKGGLPHRGQGVPHHQRPRRSAPPKAKGAVAPRPRGSAPSKTKGGPLGHHPARVGNPLRRKRGTKQDAHQHDLQDADHML
jgi:hypothetical protein